VPARRCLPGTSRGAPYAEARSDPPHVSAPLRTSIVVGVPCWRTPKDRRRRQPSGADADAAATLLGAPPPNNLVGRHAVRTATHRCHWRSEETADALPAAVMAGEVAQEASKRHWRSAWHAKELWGGASAMLGAGGSHGKYRGREGARERRGEGGRAPTHCASRAGEGGEEEGGGWSRAAGHATEDASDELRGNAEDGWQRQCPSRTDQPTLTVMIWPIGIRPSSQEVEQASFL